MGACTSSPGGGCLSSPEVPPNPERIDQTHFELLKVVGKGGFGKVNAITRKFDGQLMALKRMAKAEVIKKESHIRMVWTERNIMSKLSADGMSNPFLVSLEHAFQSEKELFFVTEFMQGGDLRYHLTKRGVMSESEVRFYSAEMVLALESMHRNKILYRDFKPDNILLDSEGHLRLSDFGLAVQLEEKHHYVMKGNAGTSGYLAPEVWAGEYYGISPDVWSLGVTCLLSSELVRLADGSTLPAGAVRKHMQLAGEFGPVEVTHAVEHEDDLPTTELFYEITLDNEAQDSFIVTRNHTLTMRVNHDPTLVRKHDSSDEMEFEMVHPTTLRRARWSNRARHSRETEEELRAAMCASYETAAEEDPRSLPATCWSRGDIVDLNVQQLVDNPSLWDPAVCAESARYFSAIHCEHAAAAAAVPPTDGCISPLPLDSSFRFIDHDEVGEFEYRPLVAGQRAKVVVVLQSSPKHEGASGKTKALRNIESALKQLKIPVGLQGGVILAELNPGGKDDLIQADMRCILHDLGAEHIIALGSANKFRWQHCVKEVEGVSKVDIIEPDTLVEFDLLRTHEEKARRVRVHLGSHPCAGIGSATQAFRACYNIPESFFHLKSIKPITYSQPKAYAPFSVDGNHRYLLASGILTHNCYELLHGRRPYRRWNPAKNPIDRLKFLPHLSPAARSFIKGLLTVDPRKRLACGPSGWSEAKAHPFFAKIDWNAIQNKIIKPPIRPDLKQANCSNQADLADQLIDKKPMEINANYQKYFAGFDYNIDFGEWLIKNEKRKEARLRKAEELKRIKAEHRLFRKQQMELAAKAGMPCSPNSSSEFHHHMGAPHGVVGVTPGSQAPQMSASGTNSLPTNSHHLVDYLHEANGGSVGLSPRPRGTVPAGPAHGVNFVDASGIQHSWQISASEDSYTHDDSMDRPVNPRLSLGMLLGQYSNAPSPHSHSASYYARASHPAGEEKCAEGMDDAHILQLTQNAHHAAISHSTSQSGFSQIHLPVNDVRMTEEADAAVRAWKENHRRERSEVKRKSTGDKNLKHRTSLSQALLSVVRAKKPSMDVNSSPGTPEPGDHRPPSDVEHALTLKLASMLQKDRANIRKIMHGDSVLSSESSSQLPSGVQFRPSQQSVENPGRIRSIAHSQPSNSNDSRGDFSTPGRSHAGGPPIFPYSSSSLSVTSMPATSSSQQSKMTHLGVPRFTNQSEESNYEGNRPSSGTSTPTSGSRTLKYPAMPSPDAMYQIGTGDFRTSHMATVGPTYSSSGGSSPGPGDHHAPFPSPTHSSSAFSSVTAAQTTSPNTPLSSTLVRASQSGNHSPRGLVASASSAPPSLAVASPQTRHRIHVSVRPPPSSTSNITLTPRDLPIAPALANSNSPRNILDQWASISATITRLRESGRKIQLLIFLDYDGTLTPIVSSPSNAVLSPSVRRTLASLLPLYPTSILTGRSLTTISNFLVGVDDGAASLHVAASHGFEILLDGLGRHAKTDPTNERVKQVGREFLPLLHQFHANLRAALEQHPQLAAHLAAESLTLENNRFSVSVHFRNLPAAVGTGLLAALDGVLDAMLTRPEYADLERHHGKMVYEIRPRIADLDGHSGGECLSGRTASSNSGWHKGCAMDFLLKHVLFPSQQVSSTVMPTTSTEITMIDTCRRLSLESGVELLPIYCGDDVTDEACFEYMEPFGLVEGDGILLPALSVYVQSSGDRRDSVSGGAVEPIPMPPTATAANFTLRNTDEVHQLLEQLVQFAKQ